MQMTNIVPTTKTDEFKAIKKIVVDTLKRYKKLDALIEQAEAVARGEGLASDFVLEVSNEEHERLATVGRAYAYDQKGNFHVQKAESLFAHMKGDDEEDQAALEQIAGLMTGTSAWGNDGVVWHERVMPMRNAMELAEWDAERFRREKEFIERAMERLKGYAPHLEKLLRMRYMDKEKAKIPAVCRALGIQTRTQDDWHNQALAELAMLLRISKGC